ncbi:ABC transporter permease [Halorhabdus salina]|uniref:ABC transporter permease n=1 Tax=Halorhabdus salina TaxID=2750670 RepID=UPI0015EF645B|nr:ABC transporter permease [Halorhabdus salina]
MSAPGADADALDGVSPTDGGDTNRNRPGEPPTGNSLLGDVRVNFARWNRKALRNPTAFFLEIVAGVFSLVLFATVFGDVSEVALGRVGYGNVAYLTYLLPAVLMQATIGSAFTSGVGLVGDLESGMFEKVLVTPMSWTAVVAGKSLSELTRIVMQLLAVLGLGVAMGATIETGIAGIVGILVVCLLVGLLFMSVANILGILTRDEEALNAATMLFMFPLLFLSPAFIPLSSDLELVAILNPITYGVEAVRALVLGEDTLSVIEVTQFGGLYDTLVPAVAILLALDLLFGALSVRMVSRVSSTAAE